MRASDRLFSSKVKLDYSLFETASQNVELSAKYSRAVKGALQRTLVAAAVRGSVLAAGYNVDATVDLQSSTDYVHNSVQLNIGDHNWSLQQLYSNQASGQQRDLNVRLALTCPQRDVDLLAFVVQHDTEDSFGASSGLRLAPGREWNAQLALQRKTQPTRSYSADAKVSSPAESHHLHGQLVETQALIQWDLAAEYKANSHSRVSVLANYKNLSDKTKVAIFFSSSRRCCSSPRPSGQ